MMFEEASGAYRTAITAAVKDLGAVDPDEVAASRGVRFDRESSAFTFACIDDELTVTYPGGVVTGNSGAEKRGASAVLALHYLVYRGEPLRTGEWLAYRDMPGGRDFSRAFESMSEARIAERFGRDPSAFAAAARKIGGRPGEVGEWSYTVRVFPRLELMVVLWPAGEGLPGAARILFRPGAPCYLHTEDLAAAGMVLADRLLG